LLDFLAHPPPKILCFIDVEGVGRVVVEPDQDQSLMASGAYSR
jgi:hypothetical protein